MPDDEFRKMSDSDLQWLLSEVKREMKRRGLFEDHSQTHAPSAESAVAEPTDADMDFCLRIKARIQNRIPIIAQEKDRIFEIARQYPQWVAKQGLPTKRTISAWTRAIEEINGLRARERK